MGWDWMGLDGMVIIGRKYSKSTFGANNSNHDQWPGSKPWWLSLSHFEDNDVEQVHGNAGNTGAASGNAAGQADEGREYC